MSKRARRILTDEEEDSKEEEEEDQEEEEQQQQEQESKDESSSSSSSSSGSVAESSPSDGSSGEEEGEESEEKSKAAQSKSGASTRGTKRRMVRRPALGGLEGLNVASLFTTDAPPEKPRIMPGLADTLSLSGYNGLPIHATETGLIALECTAELVVQKILLNSMVRLLTLNEMFLNVDLATGNVLDPEERAMAVSDVRKEGEPHTIHTPCVSLAVGCDETLRGIFGTTGLITPNSRPVPAVSFPFSKSARSSGAR